LPLHWATEGLCLLAQLIWALLIASPPLFDVN